MHKIAVECKDSVRLAETLHSKIAVHHTCYLLFSNIANKLHIGLSLPRTCSLACIMLECTPFGRYSESKAFGSTSFRQSTKTETNMCKWLLHSGACLSCKHSCCARYSTCTASSSLCFLGETFLCQRLTKRVSSQTTQPKH